VIAPAPFNFLTLPALPLYLLYPQKAPRINSFFSLFSYQVLFLVGLCAFTVYSALVSVWTYLLVPIVMVTKGGWRRSFWVVPWVFAGPAYLLFLYFYSLPSFCRYAYFEEQEENSSEGDIYRSLRDHLGRLSRLVSVHLLPFNIILPTLSQFPGAPSALLADNSAPSSARSSSVQSGTLVQSLSFLQWRKMTALLVPFKSLPVSPDKPQLIDVLRTYKFFRSYHSVSPRLKAVNISYIQRALQNTEI
jgi:hypothetical protein